jgi:hypothetical protein
VGDMKMRLISKMKNFKCYYITIGIMVFWAIVLLVNLWIPLIEESTHSVAPFWVYVEPATNITIHSIVYLFIPLTIFSGLLWFIMRKKR